MSIITDEKSRILPEKINFFPQDPLCFVFSDTGLENDRRTAEKCA
jgi:hypothetical protein